jgi:hypothetical protein
MLGWIEHHAVYAQAIGSVVLLVGFLVATTLLQQRAASENTSALKTISDRVKPTDMYGSAVAYFTRREESGLFANSAQAVSTCVLIVIVLMCSIASYFGAGWFDDDTTPSYILGGALATDAKAEGLAKFQSGTVFIGSMAFLSAYIWTIAQLVNRMNNNDMSPITFHFLSVRILTACLVAGVARHVVEAFPPLHELMYSSSKVPVGLALLGFVIGWKPTFWIDELYKKVTEFLKAKPLDQRPPNKDNLAQNMSLAMIQGMVDGKIERLQELDIDNCQRLARENAVIIWARTPYNLEMIVDWIAQAQLCVLFEDDKIELLRRAGIRDIFFYLDAIVDPTAQQAVQTVLGTVPLDIIKRHAFDITSDPAFARLSQLRKAIHPDIQL